MYFPKKPSVDSCILHLVYINIIPDAQVLYLPYTSFYSDQIRSCYFWGLFLWYMCLNTLVSKLWVAQWEGWLLPGERETLRVVVRCWEAPRLLRRSTGPTSHDTPCVPCRFPSGQCRVCGLPICICKSMTSKGNKWSIFARQVSPLFILCWGSCQKRFSGFFPLRGGGYPLFPLSFFEHNDFLLRGGVYPPNSV